MELSAKKRVAPFWDAVGGTTKQVCLLVLRVDVQHRVDPRFDSACGKFDEALYRRSYGFLDEYRKDEISELKKQMKAETDVEEKKRVQRAFTRLVRSECSIRQ